MQDRDLNYVKNRFQYSRRETIPVQVGSKQIGGNAPVLVQSMTTTKPKDTAETVRQILALSEAGCELVRITVPTYSDACALEAIVREARSAGATIPLSADIHFQPKAAFEALKWVEKVRINPGNFVDTGIMALENQTESSFEEGKRKVFESFVPFLREAKRLSRAIRIGVNHGSLSARMLYRYGDTVEGMVESALEYLAVCESENFDRVVVSLKASNPRVAIEAYRLLACRLKQLNFRAYPFHVGVTEAGVGSDGRLKSAVGIGALLLEGLGDTIRVSLTENPVAEIPVARELIRVCAENVSLPVQNLPPLTKDPYHFERRKSRALDFGESRIGGSEPVKVGVVSNVRNQKFSDDRLPEFTAVSAADQLVCVDDFDLNHLAEKLPEIPPSLFCYRGTSPVFGVRALASILEKNHREDPVLLWSEPAENSEAERLKAASVLGSLLCDGLGDAVCLAVQNAPEASVALAYDILQAAASRKSKADFISCPGCGRTLYDIQEVLGKIQNRLGHLKEISIAVMGCIVNGPGEMADADFGYVGGAPGRISLYEGKTAVRKNIPEEEALEALVELLKSRGRWQEPKI